MLFLKKIKKENKRTIYLLGLPIFHYSKKEFLPKFKKVGTNVDVQKNCRIFHPENIEIGNNVRIATGALIEGMGKLIIGNNVIFGPDVTIWTANHNYDTPDLLPYDEKVIYRPVKIEDNVWIGGKAIILPGITIHEGAVIGMGAVVTKDIPQGAVVGGNPAKILKYRNLEQYEKLKQKQLFYIFNSK